MSDRANRTWLALLALALLVLGGLGLAGDGLDLGEPSAAYRRVVDDVGGAPTAATVAAVGLALILMAVGVLLVRGQLGRRRSQGHLGQLTLQRSPGGRTTLRAVSLANAVARDLQGIAGVTRTAARLLELEPRPRLAVQIDLDESGDVGRLQEGAEEVYRRAGHALGTEVMEVRAVVRLTSRASARVR